MADLTLEQKREQFGNLLGTGEELRKTGFPVLDASLADLVVTDGRAYATMVLLLTRSKLDVAKMHIDGTSAEEIEDTLTLHSQLYAQVALHLQLDLDKAFEDADRIIALASGEIQKAKDAGDPDGIVAALREVAAQG